MVDLLDWTVLDCTGVPNKVASKCMLYICSSKPREPGVESLSDLPLPCFLSQHEDSLLFGT